MGMVCNCDDNTSSKNEIVMENNNPNLKNIKIIELKDGLIYKGQVNEFNIPDGKGIEKHITGQQYRGDFINGRKEGYGILKFKNQAIYKGEFVKNQMHGKGILEWKNGHIYDGYFNRNQFHGQGFYRLKDNQGYYKGQYKHGLKDGVGRINFQGITMKGKWEQGQMILTKQ